MAGIWIDGAVAIAVCGLVIKEGVTFFYKRGNGKDVKGLLNDIKLDIEKLNGRMEVFNRRADTNEKGLDELEKRFYDCQRTHKGG